MFMKTLLCLLCASALFFCSCGADNTVPDFKDKIAADENVNDNTDDPNDAGSDQKMPVMGTYTKHNVNVEEISGICLNKDKTGLLAVGDQGILKEIDLNDMSVKTVWTRDADLEGITLDPRTNDLYLGIEYSQKVYKLDAPDYQKHSSIIYVQEAIDKGYDNSGVEGIAYYKDDLVFVGTQWGANLWIYKLDGTMVSKTSLSSFADEIAGLDYDPVADWLWVIDSNYKKIYICKVTEKPFAAKLLATYDVSHISNAESICVDRDRDCVWVGSDESSPKIYKFNFTF